MRVILVGHSLPYSLTISEISSTNSTPYESVSASKVSSTTFASTARAQASITSAMPVKTHRRSRAGSTTIDQASISLIEPDPTDKMLSHPTFKFTEMPGHALLSAASGLLQDCERVFVGWSGPVLDESELSIDIASLGPERLEQMRASYLRETASIPIFLPEDCSRGYVDYCKSTLWPILHYQVWDDPDQCIKMEQQWPEFVRANEAFCEGILKVFKSGDVIWILDYHLMLLPGMLRKKLQTTPISFYFRSTFPSSEMIRCLPKARELMSGVLGANLVGFQIYAFARHFASCCTRILGLEASLKQVEFGGAPVELAVVSTGVDPNEIRDWLQAEETATKYARFTEIYKDQRMLIGIDRIYQVRGLVHKLAAFEMFLQSHPEWLGKVVFVQILLPDSTDTGFLNSDLSVFLDEVARINSKFGNLEYTPFQLFQQNIELSEYYALLQVADCYVSTKERDSLSLVPLDFIVCQEYSHKHSPIVLSEFTALANALSTCLRINPWNHAKIAESIYTALIMSPEEKQSRHRVVLEFALKHTKQAWSKSFFENLQGCRETIQKYSPTQYLDWNAVREAYKQARDCYFFLDYDGTLTPIVKTPSAARPSESTLESLRCLVKEAKNKVFVISGRDQHTLESWLGGIEGLGMSAEHGCFLRMPGSLQWDDLIADHSEDWKDAVTQVFEYFTDRTPGSFIEHKRASITWHYRQCDPDFGSWQARQCQSLLESTVVGKLPVEILAGKKNLEVRPVSVNKGQTLQKILSEGTSCIQADFIFCAGDDRTDEDMFEALSSVTEGCSGRISVVTCAIGSAEKKTLAKFYVNNPEQLIQFLKSLNE